MACTWRMVSKEFAADFERPKLDRVVYARVGVRPVVPRGRT